MPCLACPPSLYGPNQAPVLTHVPAPERQGSSRTVLFVFFNEEVSLMYCNQSEVELSCRYQENNGQRLWAGVGQWKPRFG